MRPVALGIVLAMLCGPSHAATVLVTVTNVRNDRGKVLVALCTRATFLRPQCPLRGHTAAEVGQVQISIEDVPPGIYAAQAFHDENDNGKLDRTLLGLPKEAMGFSNDAPMRMGPPRFDTAAFTVAQQGAAIRFALRYFSSD